jgi:hypothetical protein
MLIRLGSTLIGPAEVTPPIRPKFFIRHHPRPAFPRQAAPSRPGPGCRVGAVRPSKNLQMDPTDAPHDNGPLAPSQSGPANYAPTPGAATPPPPRLLDRMRTEIRTPITRCAPRTPTSIGCGASSIFTASTICKRWVPRKSASF